MAKGKRTNNGLQNITHKTKTWRWIQELDKFEETLLVNISRKSKKYGQFNGPKRNTITNNDIQKHYTEN